MFDLEATRHESSLIIRLSGDILMPDVMSFMKSMEGHCAVADISQIVLDLSGVARMDAPCLGVIVSLSTKMQSRGRRIVLLSPSAGIVHLLREEEIEGFFPTCQSEEELRGYIPEAAVARRGAR